MSKLFANVITADDTSRQSYLSFFFYNNHAKTASSTSTIGAHIVIGHDA